jgi:hypothetical protein
MTTTLQKAIVPNNHLVLTGITWEKFEQIETTFQDIEGIRFIYLDGELEIIINLGQEHEYYKRTISLLLEAYCREKRVRFYAGGSATLGNKNITGRKEPDESYIFHSKKDIPDLIIEVIFTSGNIKILEIYNWSLDKIDFHRLKPLLGKHWRLRIQIRFLKSETFSQLAFEALAEEISPNSRYKRIGIPEVWI